VDLDELELRPAPVPVRVAPLVQRRTDTPLEIEGRFAASRAVLLKSPASGVITGLSLQLGDAVEEGAVLCAIGDAMLRQRALASEAAVHGLEAALAEREDALAQAEQRGEPAGRLLGFEAKRRAAEHKLAQEKVQSKRHALLLENATVRAPFSGRVSSVSVASGATVVSGSVIVPSIVSPSPCSTRSARTASPKPPAFAFSSTVMTALVRRAVERMSASSSGFANRALTTATSRPSSASASAAETQSGITDPIAISATSEPLRTVMPRPTSRGVLAGLPMGARPRA